MKPYHIIILLALGGCCIKNDTLCLTQNLSFTIEIDGVDIFSEMSSIDPNEVIVFEAGTSNDLKQIGEENFYSIASIKSSRSFFIELTSKRKMLDLVYSEEQLECCSEGGIQEVLIDNTTICEGIACDAVLTFKL